MGLIGQGDQCYMLQAAFVAGAVSGTPTRGTVSGLNVVSFETFTQTTRAIGYALFTDGTLDGSWRIEVSNDFWRQGGGQRPTAGTWCLAPVAFIDTDTVQQPGLFVPNLIPVQHGASASQAQFVQAAPIAARAVRVTFIPSAGTGNATAAVSGGDY